ncbi:hypothetical protein UlMin_022108 [Ulmus minor]
MIYICFDACKKGWMMSCRRFLGLDGCHTKSFHKCQIFFALGIDADNSYFPVAYAIVESECYATWMWFLELLMNDLGIENSYGITFIIDKQKGLVQAIGNLFEHAEHRHCVRHFYANFKRNYTRDLMRVKLWQAAKSSTVEDFNESLEEIRELNEGAFEWLKEKPATSWSRSHFKTGSKCDTLINNLCESFNGERSILEARGLPIYSMLERIRLKLTIRWKNRKLYVQKCVGILGDKVSYLLEENMVKDIADWCGKGEYQISISSQAMAVVDLDKRTCTCRKFDLAGIPCSHAILPSTIGMKSQLLMLTTTTTKLHLNNVMVMLSTGLQGRSIGRGVD